MAEQDNRGVRALPERFEVTLYLIVVVGPVGDVGSPSSTLSETEQIGTMNLKARTGKQLPDGFVPAAVLGDPVDEKYSGGWAPGRMPRADDLMPVLGMFFCAGNPLTGMSHDL
jgi:hypothetical protein